MVRYFFHLRGPHDGLPDREGVLCNDMEAVRGEAVRAARELLGAGLRLGVLDLRYRVEVAREDGEVVHVLPFDQAATVISHADAETERGLEAVRALEARGH